MTTYAYDTDFRPSAPVVPLLVRSTTTGAAALVHALIDSGADMTVVPEAIARQLHLPPTDRTVVRGPGGLLSHAAVHAAQVELEGQVTTLEVLAIGQEPLVGRDLLGSFLVQLDGPHQRLVIGTSG